MERFRVWSMKRKTLADVLLKILGLSVCIYAVPSFIIGIVCALILETTSRASSAFTASNAFSFAISDGFRVVIGIYLIAKSGKIAERWFKNEIE
jgi:ABC-type dipeptide/oligopeptide/nickel transport system permease component